MLAVESVDRRDARRASRSRRWPARTSASSAATSTTAPSGRSTSSCSDKRVAVARRTGPTQFPAHARNASRRARRSSSVPATDIAGGNAQPIDESVSSLDGVPEPYARKVAAALAATPGAIDVTTSAADAAPQVNVEFNRDRARALNASIGTASTADARGVRRRSRNAVHRRRRAQERAGDLSANGADVAGRDRADPDPRQRRVDRARRRHRAPRASRRHRR